MEEHDLEHDLGCIQMLHSVAVSKFSKLEPLVEMENGD